jgi:hypothetical protein
MYCVSATECMVGCGQNSTGFGLYRTTDGGESWAAVVSSPDVLGDSRIMDIFPGDDGKLYLSGEFPADFRVVALDSDFNLTGVYERRPTVGFSFTAGSFVRTASGVSVVESLTGTDVVYRWTDSDETVDSWMSATGAGDSMDTFYRDGDDDDVAAGVQILQLAEHAGMIYGVGSTISQPPTIFIDKTVEGEEFDFSILQLDGSGLGGFIGELWDMDVNDEYAIAGGCNQESDIGIVYVAGMDSDLTAADSWTRTDVTAVFPGANTWVHGVCLGDGVMYAVGREARESWGFVLRSQDGGATWDDISYYDGTSDNPAMADMYECQVVDGDLYVAGAGGQFGIYSN